LEAFHGAPVGGEKGVPAEGDIDLLRVQFVAADGTEGVDHQKSILLKFLDLGPLISVDEVIEGDRV
jgi:hypothetical protein